MNWGKRAISDFGSPIVTSEPDGVGKESRIGMSFSGCKELIDWATHFYCVALIILGVED